MQNRSGRKIYKGIVIRKPSAQPDTIKVAIRTLTEDKKYEKRTWKSRYFLVHVSHYHVKDVEVGDSILFYEMRPISSKKNHIYLCTGH